MFPCEGLFHICEVLGNLAICVYKVIVVLTENYLTSAALLTSKNKIYRGPNSPLISNVTGVEILQYAREFLKNSKASLEALLVQKHVS